MGFEIGRRRGSLWDDAVKLNTQIIEHSFRINAKNERNFENSFSSILMSNHKKYSNKIITQIDKETIVQSSYCFGKKHRPDMTINKDGIAIEIKYVNKNTDAFKDAIGQAYLYRLRYKFVFLILVLSSNWKDLYKQIIEGGEKDLEDITEKLSLDLNVFTYIVPSFKIATNMKKIFSVFK